ncbi:MAG: V-type ATP synthase subunit D [Candidatus Methanomethylicota archaeon]|uniref:A-type ATP synthase subunit D n=1 Tax=Thermoproteota archaeon TaxID=2056631 RepID=A0A497F8U2_9CREN|nr:MAG: V-type ATP synthase subunit D [Candidatus Verstraetearchaeota archaeon]
MAIIEVKPTRMELLALKRRLKLAKRGLELLQEKQDALIMEFFAAVQDYKAVREEVVAALKDAFTALSGAEMELGALKLERIATGVPEAVEVEMKTRNVMGVLIPVFAADIKPAKHTYSLIDTSVYLDVAVEKFCSALSKIVKLAEASATLIRLAEEVRKVRRRVNALESLVIPKIEEAIRYIEFYLAEREREDIFRVKRIKKKLEMRSQTRY